MSLRDLPKPQALTRPDGYSGDPPTGALQQWIEVPSALDKDTPNTISVYDVIGEDIFGDGFSEKRLSAALRSIGPKEVTVNINSPGGDMFAGLSMYNMLREHPAKVTVKVMGIAASAASLIAMAGDEILMGAGATMMVHRSWGLSLGNTFDHAESSAMFATFDGAMAEIYGARTGKEHEAIMAMLDGPNRKSDGTLMTSAEAIDAGFADATFESTESNKADAAIPAHILARRRMEASMAKDNVPRSERDRLFKSMLGERDAAPTAARDAGELTDALSDLLTTVSN